MVTGIGRPLLALAACCALLGCSTRRVLVVPPEWRAKPKPATSSSSVDRSTLPPPPANVRLAENGRVWEVELPQSNGGYEVRVPLATGTNGIPEMPTLADQELLGDAAPAGTREAAAAGDVVPAKAVDARAQGAKKSYLGGLAKVTELYRAHRFELALVSAVELEQAFPQDARLQAMKGSILLKLQRIPQARAAYQKALSLNPDDAGVAEALRSLSEGD